MKKAFFKIQIHTFPLLLLGILIVLFSACKKKLDEPEPEPYDDIPPVSTFFTVDGKKLISPEGQPILLNGWRIDAYAWENQRYVSLADYSYWATQGLLGNAQGIEIWWSRGNVLHTCELYAQKPGVYQTENIPNILFEKNEKSGPT